MKNKQDCRENVKLDEIMRLLFDMSKETLVNMLNGLFGETRPRPRRYNKRQRKICE